MMNFMNVNQHIPPLNEEQSIIAVLFASGDPLPLNRLAEILEIDPMDCETLVGTLNSSFEQNNSALTILRLGESYQLSTRTCYTPLIKKLANQRRNALPSQAAMEILAIVAYNQPVTRSFIEQVRGVECGSTIGSLIEKGLLEEAGRLELPGRPISYKTTENFLRVFGLSDLSELPDLQVPTQENDEK